MKELVQLLTALEFSRDQEAAADAEALVAVARLYGHVDGGTELFRVLLEQERTALLPAARLEFLRSHPLSEDRISAIEAQAREQGWRLSGKTTPLPAFIPSPFIEKTRP